jgi:parallel beta-helix repeat protein
MKYRFVYCTLLASSLIAFSPFASAAATLCVNPSGTSGCFSTISAAVATAAWGDTVFVAPGVYKEDVLITKSISLVGRSVKSTIIDAKGLTNGIFINGIPNSPKAGVTDVTITGFTIKNADLEGILAASASGVTIAHNHVTKNNLRLTGTDGMCPDLPPFETSELMDCGEGIHLMGTDHSVVSGNLIDENSGGILVTDETGPNYANLITENTVTRNGEACGITLASHPAYPAGLSFGVFQNTVSKNESSYNGLNNATGAGIGMYSPGPGQLNYGNVAIGNRLIGNGLPGVAMHNHALVPNTPTAVLRDNSVIDNYFRSNGADTGDAATAGPTGINISSLVAVTGIVISGNVFEDEAIGISFNSPATAAVKPPQMQAHFNLFEPATVGIATPNAATVNGTLNWWGCPAGPGNASCATGTTSVLSTPWLTKKPETEDSHFDN